MNSMSLNSLLLKERRSSLMFIFGMIISVCLIIIMVMVAMSHRSHPDHSVLFQVTTSELKHNTRIEAVLNGTGSRDLLTIVLDRERGDDKCVAFLHILLPSWVRWRYVTYFSDRELIQMNIETPVLVVTRWINANSPILAWASNHQYPVGLMLMADELNQQDATVYKHFDYVLRHYYFKPLKSDPDLTLHALGNITCGTGPEWPPASPSLSPNEPRLGLHWIMLQARGMGQLDSHHAPGSHWPASQRTTPAVWIGSLRADRPLMVDVMRAAFPDADIQIEEAFDGTVGPLEYSHVRLPRAVFALIPSGNNPETHRLAESMDQGCIPVQLESAFQSAMFEQVPGIRARTWAEAARKMKKLLNGDPEHLDAMQAQVTDWYRRWKSCMTSDLDHILSATMSLK